MPKVMSLNPGQGMFFASQIFWMLRSNLHEDLFPEVIIHDPEDGIDV